MCDGLSCSTQSLFDGFFFDQQGTNYFLRAKFRNRFKGGSHLVSAVRKRAAGGKDHTQLTVFNCAIEKDFFNWHCG